MDGRFKRDLRGTQRESSAYFPDDAARFPRHFLNHRAKISGSGASLNYQI